MFLHTIRLSTLRTLEKPSECRHLFWQHFRVEPELMHQDIIIITVILVVKVISIPCNDISLQVTIFFLITKYSVWMHSMVQTLGLWTDEDV